MADELIPQGVGGNSSTAVAEPASPSGAGTGLSDVEYLESLSSTAELGKETPASPAPGAETPATEKPADTPDQAKAAAEEADLFGGKLPQDLQTAFNANPAFRNRIFKDGREAKLYREVFPSPDVARAWKDNLEAHGLTAPEQIAEQLEKARDMDETDQRFDAGDPESHTQLIQGIFDRNPQNARSLLQTAVRMLPEVDKEGYAQIATGIYEATVAARNIPQLLENLFKIAEDEKVPDRDRLYAEVKEALLGNMPKAGKTAARTPDPEVERYKTENAKLKQEREDARLDAEFKAVDSKVTTDISTFVFKAVDDAFKAALGEKFDDRREIAGELHLATHEALKADPIFKERYGYFQALMKSKGLSEQQRQQLATLILNRTKQVFPAVAERVIGKWTRRLLGANGVQRTANSTAATRGTEVGAGATPSPQPEPVPNFNGINPATKQRWQEHEILGWYQTHPQKK